ncbi:hypothetical protein OAT67_00895 [Bacteriovoracaceae bacterium]|nr:hypothetical protein [Bacteriovoracaceae bacterium]
MKFRFCLSFLLLLNLTACNDSKDSSAPAVANSITTESKKTVASESLSAVDSLQNFTVNIDAKNELKLSQDLAEVQKELERVKIEKVKLKSNPKNKLNK